MSMHASCAGGEGAPRMDWEVLRAADAIVEIIVRRDAARYGDAVVDRFSDYLQRVSERLALQGNCRDAQGKVCHAMIRAYFNAGPRREMMRIVATTPAPLDDECQCTARVSVDPEQGEDRARVDAFKALIIWAASLRSPVGLAVLARACGVSFDAIADIAGVRRNTLIKAVGRAYDAAPAIVRAQLLAPKRGTRPRGRPDADLVRLCAAILDGYNALNGPPVTYARRRSV